MNTYETIDLNDYVQTGEGGTALTYNHKDGKTLAKLFMPSVTADNAIREFSINQVVYELGLPTPKPIRLITDGTRYGAEYELIQPKRSFTRIISQEPDQLVPLSERFAVLAKQIHQTPADTKRLPDMKELVMPWIDKISNLPDDLRARINRFMDSIPSTPTCLHGDLHIGNIITDGQRDLWIDVGDFAYGVPEWDLGMMYYASNYMSEPRALSIFHLPIEVLKQHWAVFAKAYYGTTNQEELRKKEQALFPFFAVKMLLVISKIHNGQGAPSDMILSLIRRCLGI